MIKLFLSFATVSMVLVAASRADAACGCGGRSASYVATSRCYPRVVPIASSTQGNVTYRAGSSIAVASRRHPAMQDGTPAISPTPMSSAPILYGSPSAIGSPAPASPAPSNPHAGHHH